MILGRTCIVFSLWTLLLLGCGGPPGSRPSVRESSEAAPPKIEFPETERDLGNVPVDRESPRITTFSFRNAGGSPLHITKIEESCLCAGARVEPLVLSAGEQGEVHVALKRISPQPHSATVTLHTNGPNAKPVQLSVKWKAVAPVEFEPYSLDLGSLLPGTKVDQRVIVAVRSQDDGSPPCEFGTIECSPAGAIHASWEGNIDAPLQVGEALGMRVVVQSGAELGDHHGNVVLTLVNCRLPDLTLPVQWTVRDLIEASPPSLFLGSDKAGAPLAKAVTISAPANEDLEVVEVRVIPAGSPVSATVGKVSRNTVLIKVKAQLPHDSGPKNWQISVACSRPVARTLNVPITAYTLERD